MCSKKLLCYVTIGLRKYIKLYIKLYYISNIISLKLKLYIIYK